MNTFPFIVAIFASYVSTTTIMVDSTLTATLPGTPISKVEEVDAGKVHAVITSNEVDNDDGTYIVSYENLALKGNLKWDPKKGIDGAISGSLSELAKTAKVDVIKRAPITLGSYTGEEVWFSASVNGTNFYGHEAALSNKNPKIYTVMSFTLRENDVSSNRMFESLSMR
jgi:hypothetical protein